MLALLLGAGSGVNPSQGIPGPFSFKRLQIWITDALVERTAQLINRSSPTSRNHSPHPSTFSSSPVCTLRRPTSLALPSGFMSQMGATITRRMKSTSPLWSRLSHRWRPCDREQLLDHRRHLLSAARFAVAKVVSRLTWSALCHVWTAPGWQVKTSRHVVVGAAMCSAC